MHLSPSAVSRSIQRMESELGCELFERDNRHVRLTAAGVRMHRHAREVLDSWVGLKSALIPAGRHLRGVVSVYCSVTAAYSVLSKIMPAFRRAYPDIDIKLHTGDEADALDRAARGTDDVVIAAHPETLSTQLRFLTLVHSPLLFVYPAINCPVAAMISDSLTDGGKIPWQQVPFIVPERGLARRQWESWCAASNVLPQIYAQISGHEALLNMVALGLGTGVVPELVLANSPLVDKVKVLNVQPPLRPYAVGLCVRKDRLGDELIGAFWQTAEEVYQAALVGAV